jgi:hypothetical protein
LCHEVAIGLLSLTKSRADHGKVFTKYENPAVISPMAKKKRFLGCLRVTLPPANNPNPSSRNPC